MDITEKILSHIKVTNFLTDIRIDISKNNILVRFIPLYPGFKLRPGDQVDQELIIHSNKFCVKSRHGKLSLKKTLLFNDGKTSYNPYILSEIMDCLFNKLDQRPIVYFQPREKEDLIKSNLISVFREENIDKLFQ